MLQKYINSVKEKPTHERRAHAMQVSFGIVAVVALGWVVMLPLRFANFSASQQSSTQAANASQAAGVAYSQQGNATLLVATSSSPFGTQ